MNWCTQEGHYRIKIHEYGLKEMESGAVAVSIRAILLERFEQEEWRDVAHLQEECEGDVWIIKKDGSTNDMAVESLAKFAGWDGDMESLSAGTWRPKQCQGVVKREVYNNQTRYKISFLNDWDRVPGGMGNVSQSRLQELMSKHGRALRGLAAPHAALPPAPANRDDAAIPF